MPKVIITKKSTVNPIIESMRVCLEEKDFYGCVALFHKKILIKKTKFPILEYTTREVFQAIPEPCQIPFCDKITRLNEMGSSVVTGIALQMRLENHLEESIAKSIEYIKHGNEWFHCDHISERVLGFGILNYPEILMSVLPAFLKEKNKWVIRMVGVGGHYAVKKGLKRVYVEELFRLLVNNANRTDPDEKSGIGWAAKTTAKFHPDIVAKYKNHLENAPEVGQWFQAKVELGLSQSEKYSSRYTE